MPDVSGFLNLHKPVGQSSFAFVSMVRRLTGVKRVGHGGTLDPEASGVLPICVGQGTRMAEHFLEQDKEYVATVRLGIETDSYDAAGRIVAEADPSGITLSDIERLLPAFTGHIQQVPPMYSALKREGKPLYALARQGIEVERAARDVVIHRLEVLDWQPPCFSIKVECSRGTYIRSLAYDLGRLLGCGAHLQSLARTRVGPLNVREGVTPEQFTAAVREGWWEALLYPLDQLVLDMPAAILDEDTGRAVREGRLCRAEDSAPPPHDAQPCRAYTGEGDLLALLSYDAAAQGWRPSKVFAR